MESVTCSCVVGGVNKDFATRGWLIPDVLGGMWASSVTGTTLILPVSTKTRIGSRTGSQTGSWTRSRIGSRIGLHRIVDRIMDQINVSYFARLNKKFSRPVSVSHFHTFSWSFS